ncbi:MAG: hypothetical protein M1831_001368 [Alyxoria varia]|nr:MAG: hypothetical protein M1831_001368 [Alyxoria varia]
MAILSSGSFYYPFCYTVSYVSESSTPIGYGCTDKESIDWTAYTIYTSGGKTFTPSPVGVQDTTSSGSISRSSPSTPDSDASATSSASDEPRSLAGPLAGGIVGGIAVIGAVVGFIAWFVLRKRKKAKDTDPVQSQAERPQYAEADGSVVHEMNATDPKDTKDVKIGSPPQHVHEAPGHQGRVHELP